jgi:ribonuclease P protein component
MFTFKKTERLCSRKAIETLHAKGKAKNFFPFRVIVLKSEFESAYPVRFMVSVPKKRIRLAVKRNRVKRLTREAWRLNKHILYKELNAKNLKCDVMLIYLQSDLPTLESIKEKLPKVFNFILGEIKID